MLSRLKLTNHFLLRSVIIANFVERPTIRKRIFLKLDQLHSWTPHLASLSQRWKTKTFGYQFCFNACYTSPFLLSTKVPPLLVLHTSQRGKINAWEDTLWNGLTLPVCYPAAINVREMHGAPLPTLRFHQQRMVKGLVSWTSTTVLSSEVKIQNFGISRALCSWCCQR